jgi:hypothetical protein
MFSNCIRLAQSLGLTRLLGLFEAREWRWPVRLERHLEVRGGRHYSWAALTILLETIEAAIDVHLQLRFLLGPGAAEIGHEIRHDGRQHFLIEQLNRRCRIRRLHLLHVMPNSLYETLLLPLR